MSQNRAHEVVVRSRPETRPGHRETEWQASFFAKTRALAMAKARRWLRKHVGDGLHVVTWDASPITTFLDIVGSDDD